MNTNNTSNPPFRINQRVVALQTHSDGDFKKGDIRVVLGLKFGCCEWEVDIGIKGAYLMLCAVCGKEEDTRTTGFVNWFSASVFAPIEENKERIRYVAVSETLREKAEEVVVESCNLS